MRFTSNRLFSSYNRAVLDLPFSSIKTNQQAVTGSLGIILIPLRDWHINLIGSTGFRNPNIDDMGKIRTSGSHIIIPAKDIKPEYAYNGELTVERVLDGYIRASATVFATLLTNAIVRQAYAYNGLDSMQYQGYWYMVQANTNAERALVKGVQMALESDLNTNLAFKSTINYVVGKDISNNEPLGHIPPIFGQTTISYRIKKLENKMYLKYNGWKHKRDFSPDGEDKEDEATKYGYPGWYTVNIQVVYNAGKYISLQFAVENIFDQFYKPYASAIAAPGRNFVVGIRASI
ncbi:MAG: TonB-dependent receptor [Bacteroidales bacterium]|nr:TonB-dependent receptor [Bacteroidales bacterium]